MRVYSVSEYREELNELLSNVTVAIEAEITSLNVSQNRFVWFTLADEHCAIDCFMMQFEMSLPLEEGMRVRVIGSPTMFKKGKVVFRPRRVELIGDGDLQKAFQLLKAQLEKEGLFDEARKRQLPKIPRRIGIVTSRDAAAYTDVLRVLENRWPFVEVVLVHVQVQGADAAASIVRGLNTLYAYARRGTDAAGAAAGNARAAVLHSDVPLDAILVTRGGGSLEDLQAFNTEEVVRAVYASPVPVMTAIGHERDTTLVDFVADVRAATPSNAAELLVPHIDDVTQTIAYHVSRVQNAVQHAYRDIDHRLSELMSSLKYHISKPIQQSQELLYRLQQALQNTAHDIALKQQRVEAAETLLHSVNPQTLFERGFSVTRDAKGRILRSAHEAKKAGTIQTQFADGVAESEVRRIITTNQ